MSGTTHNWTGTTHNWTGTTHNWTGTTHNWTEQAEQLEGEATEWSEVFEERLLDHLINNVIPELEAKHEKSRKAFLDDASEVYPEASSQSMRPISYALQWQGEKVIEGEVSRTISRALCEGIDATQVPSEVVRAAIARCQGLAEEGLQHRTTNEWGDLVDRSSGRAALYIERSLDSALNVATRRARTVLGQRELGEIADCRRKIGELERARDRARKPERIEEIGEEIAAWEHQRELWEDSLAAKLRLAGAPAEGAKGGLPY